MDGWIEELIADDQERTKVLLKKRCCRHDSSTINCKNIHMGPCTKMKMIITARVATVQKLLADPGTRCRKHMNLWVFLSGLVIISTTYLQFILQNNVLLRIGTIKWKSFLMHTKQVGLDSYRNTKKVSTYFCCINKTHFKQNVCNNLFLG